MFSISALSAVHRLSISQTEMRMLTAADHAAELARASAAAAMQQNAAQESILSILTEPPNITGSADAITIHTTIDTALGERASAQSSCATHDVDHACNLAGGAELRTWETIDLRSTSGNETLTLRRHILLRLLRNKPYATIAAVRDDGAAGSQMLGDPAGVPAAVTDIPSPSAGDPWNYHDTRVHVYAPCRFVGTNNPAMASDKHTWANWEGTQASPARQNACTDGAGETTEYVSSEHTAPNRSSSTWGH